MNAFRAFSAAFVLAALSAIVTVDAQTTLPPVNVEANYCDYAVNCTFSSGMDAFLVPIGPAFPPNADSISPDDNPLIATCNSLRNRAAQIGCDTSNPPPAPGFPSPTQGSWAPNGCGDGSITTRILMDILGSQIDGYTGDHTNPLPGVSFKEPCDAHDRCYHMSASKSICDHAFAHSLDHSCHDQATDSLFAQCMLFAGAYATAVDEHGQSAYGADQWAMECAKISSELNSGNCVSS